MKSDVIWPTEVRGENAAAVAWLNRMLRACKQSAIHDVKLVGGTAKIQNGSLILSMIPGGAGGGGFDIYDQTKDYAAGETFFVPLPTTIAGIAVAAGLYGVPAAGTNSVGTFAGGVPANPTGNAVPQFPMPSIGAAPNDKYYSILISGVCAIL